MANYGWKWPLLLFLDAIATVDVLTPASKNDGKHIEIRTVHFAWPKVSFRFWENKQTRRRLLARIGKFYHLFPPGIPPDVALIPWIIKSVQRWRISWMRSARWLWRSKPIKNGEMSSMNNNYNIMITISRMGDHQTSGVYTVKFRK